MIYNMDTRAKCKTLMDQIRFESPFVSFMPESYEYPKDGVDFVYSDLGISKGVIEKLIPLTVIRDGKEFKFHSIGVSIEHTGEYEFPDGTIEDAPVEGAEEIVNQYLVVKFR